MSRTLISVIIEEVQHPRSNLLIANIFSNRIETWGAINKFLKEDQTVLIVRVIYHVCYVRMLRKVAAFSFYIAEG